MYKRVAISSTIKGLKASRDAAKTAITSLGLLPTMMEYMGSSESVSVTESLKLIDNCDVYVGIVAFKYGSTAVHGDNPNHLSHTELEYERAKVRNIPRMIFLASVEDSYQLEPGDSMETDPELYKRLLSFRKRLETENIVKYFQNPTDLNTKLMLSLATHPSLTHSEIFLSHRPSPLIVSPQTAKIANLYGRDAIHSTLIEWVKNHSFEKTSHSLLNLTGRPGIGKTAVAWEWFNTVGSLTEYKLDGRIWWSFNGRTRRFDMFCNYLRAYILQQPLHTMSDLPLEIAIQEVLHELNRGRFLIVLDSLERCVLDLETYPKFQGQVAKSLSKQGELFDEFIVQCANLERSQVLITSRTSPSCLMQGNDKTMPGSNFIALEALDKEIALTMWNDLGLSSEHLELLGSMDPSSFPPGLVFHLVRFLRIRTDDSQ